MALAISPDETILASGSQDNRIILWSITEEERLASLEDHTNDVVSLTINSEGTRLFSGSIDGTIKIWSLPDGELLRGGTGWVLDTPAAARGWDREPGDRFLQY